MPEINVKVLLATFDLQNGTTEGVIKVTSSDSSSTVLTDDNRLNAICTNLTFVLKTNSLLDTHKSMLHLEDQSMQLYMTLMQTSLKLTLSQMGIY